VNFLLHGYPLHCVSWFSLFLPGAELLMPDSPNSGRETTTASGENRRIHLQTAPKPDFAHNLP
jgi:hypothetical protein